MKLQALDIVARATDDDDRTDRGNFLARAGAASLAALTGIVAVSHAPPAMAAGEAHGCDLCVEPNPAACVNIACWWCWWGRPHRNGPCPERCHVTQCCEGYTAGGAYCNAGCEGRWACSVYGTNTRATGCGPC